MGTQDAQAISTMDLIRWAAINAPAIAVHVEVLIDKDSTNKQRAEALKGLIDVAVTLFPDHGTVGVASAFSASAITTQGWEEIVKIGLPILLELIRNRRARRQGGSPG